MKKLSHFGKGAKVAMVNVSAKAATVRQASARGFMRIGRAALGAVRRRKTPKGDPLEIAQDRWNCRRQARFGGYLFVIPCPSRTLM